MWRFTHFQECFHLIKIKGRFFRGVNAVTGLIVCVPLWAYQAGVEGSGVRRWSVVWTAWWSWGERGACCSHSRSAQSWAGTGPWGACWEMGSTHQIAHTRTDCRNMGVLSVWMGGKGMTEFSVCLLANNGRNMHAADALNLIFPAQVV